VWNNVVENNQDICERAGSLLTNWQNAQVTHNTRASPTGCGEQVQWNKTSVSRYKCNMDASFSHSLNKVDIQICIRDEEGRFVLRSPKWKGLDHYLT
jgi:hypothetical protein